MIDTACIFFLVQKSRLKSDGFEYVNKYFIACPVPVAWHYRHRFVRVRRPAIV